MTGTRGDLKSVMAQLTLKLWSKTSPLSTTERTSTNSGATSGRRDCSSGDGPASVRSATRKGSRSLQMKIRLKMIKYEGLMWW